jgi:hypothetical protein
MKEDQAMRKIVLAIMALTTAGVAGAVTSTPAAAGAWCVQGRDEGYPGDCSYASYGQCMASASGRNAYCGVNPRAAFRGQGGPRGRSADPYGYYQSPGYYQPYGYYR